MLEPTRESGEGEVHFNKKRDRESQEREDEQFWGMMGAETQKYYISGASYIYFFPLREEIWDCSENTV